MQYWPEELQDSVTFGEKFEVTLSSSLPFAEYEIREFILQNVSSKPPAGGYKFPPSLEHYSTQSAMIALS